MVFSDERVAKTAAGLVEQVDGYPDDHRPSPVVDDSNPLIRDESRSYAQWLTDQGFCSPNAGSPPGCIQTNARVVVVDSGIDDNECDEHGGDCDGTSHPDFVEGPDPDDPDRQVQFFCVDDGQACDSGSQYVFSDMEPHGTFVASIIAGRPQLPGAVDGLLYRQGTGIVPKAQIVLAKLTEHDGDYVDLTPALYEDLIADIYSANPGQLAAANNSWNQVIPGDQDGNPVVEYTTLSQKADELVRDADGGFNNDRPLAFVWSAGNEKHYHLDDFVGAPANAKNVITVGASMGWGSFSEVESPAMELDCLYSNLPQFQYLSVDDVQGFSRRGFADSPPWKLDYLRFDWKPDLMAPSKRTRAAVSMYTDASGTYDCFTGTSASAPVVTGGVALLREWFSDRYDDYPSPAMTKAMLIAHADDMAGGYDRLAQEVLPHSPSVAQGWGRVDLGNVFATSPTNTEVVDESVQLGHAEDYVEKLEVVDPSEPVLIVLTWTDPAAQPSASSLLVNDLVLKAHAPFGGGYQGNIFEVGGWYSEELDAFPKSHDFFHNVRVIRIPPAGGSWWYLEVDAASINANAVPGEPEPVQDFALYVVNGTFL
jgi:subtilisin family serine protease